MEAQKRRMQPGGFNPFDRMLAGMDNPGSGGTGDLTAGDYTLKDRLTDLVSYLYGGSDPKAAQSFGRSASDLATMVPGPGQVLSGDEALRAARKGDYSGAALAGIGALPGGGPEANAGREALAEAKLAAPAVHTGGNQSLIDKIFQHAEQQRTPQYPTATEPVFGPADPELTKQLVPQRSVAGELPPVPTGKLPYNDRARPILENQDAIAKQMADDLTKAPGQPEFYSTGSVLAGLEDRAGLRPKEALDFMGDWSGQGAATSPRTKTPQNLRNASYLMFERARGNPLTSARREAEGNRPGFAMMGMHTDLADQFAKGTVDPWTNPKPFTFQQNWKGNMADVTGDTHNIRKVLDTYDRLNPGGLPKEWFSSEEAYQAYKANKGFPKEGALPVGDIRDSLGSGIVPGTGRKAQVEYPIITNPTRLTAEKMGIAPAEAQERLWFEGGPRTGLMSPAVTIPGLLNSQIEATARATGLSPDAILKLWAHRGIPLAQNEPDNNMPGASAVG
jgi:hypothetical protein